MKCGEDFFLIFSFFSLRNLACLDVVIIFVLCVDSWKLGINCLLHYEEKYEIIYPEVQAIHFLFVCSGFFHLHILRSKKLGE